MKKTNKSHQSLSSDQSAKIYRKPTWASRSSRLATFERKVLCRSKWPFISCYSLIQCFWLWSSKTLTKSGKKLNSNCRHTTRHTFFWRLTQILIQCGLSTTEPPHKFMTLFTELPNGQRVQRWWHLHFTRFSGSGRTGGTGVELITFCGELTGGCRSLE